MALKTSLVIAGDADQAKSALVETEAELGKAAEQAKRLSEAFADADRSIEKLAAAQAVAQQETAKAKASFAAGEISVREYNAQLLETRTALSLVESEHKATVSALRQSQAALGGATVSAGQARAGYQNLGRQMQDVAVQLQGGANIGTILAQQGGQVADALAMMGGRFAGVAEFLAGPWGAAIIVGAGALLNYLIPALTGAGDETDKMASRQRSLIEVLGDSKSSWLEVAQAARDYADAQAKANQSTLQSLKLEAEVTRQRLLSAVAIRKELAAKLASAQVSEQANAGQGSVAGGGSFLAGVQQANIKELLASNSRDIDALQAAANSVGIKVASEVAKINSDPVERIKVGFEALRERARAAGLSVSDLTARLAELNRQEAKAIENERKSPSRKKADTQKAAAREARQAQQLSDFGLDAGRQIQSIKDQYSDLPSVVGRTNSALRELDKIAANVATRKPPNLKTLLADIASARDLIQEGLNKPFNDFMEKTREAAEIDKLLVQGRDDEAEALKIILQLQREQGPLSQEQLGAVLQTVQAERVRSMVLRDQRALIQSNVRAVQDMRGALEQTVADALRGRLSLSNILNSFANSYIQITSQRIVEKLFGDTLRSLEDQASGAGKVDKAGTQIAAALDKGSAAVKSFADVVNEANRKIGNGVGTAGGGTGGGGIASAIDAAAGSLGGVLGDFIDRFKTALPSLGNGTQQGTGDEIVVTGKKSRPLPGQDAGSILVDLAGGLTRDLGIHIPDAVSESLKGVLSRLEKSLPAALAGAFTGASASRIFLGDRGSGVGGAIGGAIGQKLGEKVLGPALGKLGGELLGKLGGPIGSALGGILGGLVGGLFKSSKTGYAVVSNTGISQGGNNAERKQQTATLGSSIQTAIQQIADQFGAAVGDYAVSIGMRNDYYRVSASGSSRVSDKYFSQHNTNPDSLYDGQDAQQALSLAIQNAIQDGAIKGVSAAVQKALASDSNIDKAIREALKVQDVELALGGLGAQLEKQFRTFEVQAQDRLRIARQYGFDVVAMEKKNAEDRLKLADQLLKQQVGSLQQLITDMTSGSMFEGSAVDQRQAILAQIVQTKADADKGVEGAADKLSQLLQQLNAVSKQAYGTTGTFAADRQTILDAARDTIAKANQRVADAQKASESALTETNTQLNESNDLLSKISTNMGLSLEYLKQIAAKNGGIDFSALRAAAATT